MSNQTKSKPAKPNTKNRPSPRKVMADMLWSMLGESIIDTMIYHDIKTYELFLDTVIDFMKDKKTITTKRL